MQSKTKPWYQSKTLWLAVLQMAIGVATLTTGVLNGTTPLNDAGMVIILKSVLDMVIRFKTDSQITVFNP
jgi:uncharacterized membrane protein